MTRTELARMARKIFFRRNMPQMLFNLNRTSEKIWRHVSRNRGDRLMIAWDASAKHFVIWRDGDHTPFATTESRRQVDKIMRRFYYRDVLFHGTD